MVWMHSSGRLSRAEALPPCFPVAAVAAVEGRCEEEEEEGGVRVRLSSESVRCDSDMVNNKGIGEQKSNENRTKSEWVKFIRDRSLVSVPAQISKGAKESKGSGTKGEKENGRG